MEYYYVNMRAQPNGDHEVHRMVCPYPADAENRLGLGFFANCQEAVRAAKNHYRGANGCYWCSTACHTQ